MFQQANYSSSYVRKKLGYREKRGEKILLHFRSHESCHTIEVLFAIAVALELQEVVGTEGVGTVVDTLHRVGEVHLDAEFLADVELQWFTIELYE